MRTAGYRLAKTHVVDLYLVADHGGGQADFWQPLIHLEDERLDCEPFSAYDSSSRGVRDLITHAEGPPLPEEQQVRLRPPRHALMRAQNIGRPLTPIVIDQ